MAAVGAMTVLIAVRIGVFTPWVDVTATDGTVRVANGLASVDHPFHVARAELLRRSLLAGEIPRWIGSHQGGYPVEFYPLGAAWLTLAAWAATLGSLPILWAHGVAVAAILLLPGLGFWLLTRRDRLPPGTAALALAAHLAVAGAWWHGGYTELVQWGLVTNVAGAAWAFVTLPLLVRWLADGRGRDGALAMATAALALLTNPRSGFGLAVVGLAAVVVCAAPALRASRRTTDASPNHHHPTVATTPSAPFRLLSSVARPFMAGSAGASIVAARAAVVGIGAALLAASELVALLRFSHLYVFKHYESYEGIGAYWASSVEAVSPPVFALAVLGFVCCWTPLGRARPGIRAAALALALYAGFTWTAATGALPVGQLEATRLMPLQRLLTIWLAAAAVGMAVEWALGWFRAKPAAVHAASAPPQRTNSEAGWSPVAASAAPIVIGGLLLAWWLRPGGEPLPLPGPPDAPSRGLYPVVRTDAASFADLEAAVRLADAAAPPGTAILVLGSTLSWHQQLWAPRWSDRPFLYDDWLWFWRTDHAGTPDYAFDRGHFYPDPARALDQDYLERHGIGAVVVTGDALAAAANLPWLAAVSPASSAPSSPAAYRVWTVRDPSGLLTVAGRNAADPRYAAGRVSGVAPATGEATIRHAWFPRWQVTVDGRPTAIARAADGTMRLPNVPADARIELTYQTDAWDWTAHAMTLAGLALAILVWRRPRARPAPPTAQTARLPIPEHVC